MYEHLCRLVYFIKITFLLPIPLAVLFTKQNRAFYTLMYWTDVALISQYLKINLFSILVAIEDDNIVFFLIPWEYVYS